MKKEAKEKLKEKNIDWKQVYTDKTEFLKEQFEDTVGPGSYFRFEGEAATDGDKYYCILGPAKVHDPRAKFFAGVRKLPATYSAGGKYFDSMDAAAAYALETWGVPTPKSLKPYTSAALYGLSEKVNKWKAEREESEGEDDKKDSKKESQMKFNLKRVKEALSKEADRITKEAMPREVGSIGQKNRPNYTWWNMDDLGNDPTTNTMFADYLEEDPSLLNAFNRTKFDYDYKFKPYFKRKYGINENDVVKIYKMFFGYHPRFGAYYSSIGPYKGNREEGEDKFGYFVYRMKQTNSASIQASMAKKISDYIQSMGESLSLSVDDFNSSDFEVSLKSSTGSTKPNSNTQAIEKHLNHGSLDDPAVIRQLQEMGLGDFSFDFTESDTPTMEEEIAEGESEEMGGFYDAEFNFNTRGSAKIFENMAQNGNYGNLLEQALERVGNDMGSDPIQVRRNMYTDENTLKRVVNITHSIFERISDEEKAALGISAPPVKLDKSGGLKSLGRSGQLIPKQLEKRKDMAQKMQFKIMVTDLMIEGIEEPIDIFNHIVDNNRKYKAIQRKDARDGTNKLSEKITVEYIEHIVGQINNARFTESETGELNEIKPLNQIMVEQSDLLEKYENEYGYDSLQDAFKMCAEYFSSMPVEYITSSKLATEDTEVVFNPPGDILDLKSEDLELLRTRRGTLTDEQIAQIINDTEGLQSVEEILSGMGVNVPATNTEDESNPVFDDEEDDEEDVDELEVGDDFDIVDTDLNIDDLDIEDLDVEPEPSPSAESPASPAPVNLDDLPEVEPQTSRIPKKKEENPFDINLDDLDDLEDLTDASNRNRSVVANTLNNLINIAEKMDEKGDSENAEKVHALIKKYMGE